MNIAERRRLLIGRIISAASELNELGSTGTGSGEPESTGARWGHAVRKFAEFSTLKRDAETGTTGPIFGAWGDEQPNARVFVSMGEGQILVVLRARTRDS